MTEIDERVDIRHLTKLWQDLCTCGGPQPGITNAQTEEHQEQCRYRIVAVADSNQKAAEQNNSRRGSFCFTCNRNPWGSRDSCRRYGHRLSKW
jgi:hypothetical protein